MHLGKTSFAIFPKLIPTAKINANVDENVNIQKSKGMSRVWDTPNTIKTHNGQIRDDKDRSI